MKFVTKNVLFSKFHLAVLESPYLGVKLNIN